MKVGSMVFATVQGLGLLAKDFYDNRVITDVCIIQHGRRVTHQEWYPPGTLVITDLKSGEQRQMMDDFCRRMDTMLFFETPFVWELIPACRAAGVKTALMPMYECTQFPLPYTPDIIINPSLLDQAYYPSGKFIPVPVPRYVKWKQRTEARVFVHNSGNGGLMGRNGTQELWDALPFIKVPATLVFRSQIPLGLGVHQQMIIPVIKVLDGMTVAHDDLYDEGDVFIFPEKFNGLSLPLQEAHAAGMLVMCGNRFPMNSWLPTPPLIPVAAYQERRTGHRQPTFQEAVFEPRQIAETINNWYGKDITAYSQRGKDWAEAHSWDVLKPTYMEVLAK